MPLNDALLRAQNPCAHTNQYKVKAMVFSYLIRHACCFEFDAKCNNGARVWDKCVGGQWRLCSLCVVCGVCEWDVVHGVEWLCLLTSTGVEVCVWEKHILECVQASACILPRWSCWRESGSVCEPRLVSRVVRETTWHECVWVLACILPRWSCWRESGCVCYSQPASRFVRETTRHNECVWMLACILPRWSCWRQSQRAWWCPNCPRVCSRPWCLGALRTTQGNARE